MISKDRSDKFRNYIYDIEKDKVRAQKENYIIEAYDDEDATTGFTKGYQGVTIPSQNIKFSNFLAAHRRN